MDLNQKVFRVFISSTFSDLKAERNALQTEVFPKLQEYCATAGARFQAIDLRWGIRQEASRDQKTIQICLDEIKRCQLITPRPNFLALLGNRYGWCPPPYTIPFEELIRLVQKMNNEDKTIITRWYRLDSNARNPEYILQPWWHLSYDEWRQVEKRLAGILLNTALDAGFDANSSFKYWASATHQEIEIGALSTEVEPKFVFGFFRNIDSIPLDASAKDFIDLDISAERTVLNRDAQSHLLQLKQNLKHKLTEDNIRSYAAEWTSDGPTEDHIKGLCTDVHNMLKAALTYQIEHYQELDPLTSEITAQESILKKHNRYFTGRKNELKQINSYLNDETPYPLIILGDSGAGKSALMAAAIDQAKQSHHELKIVYRFISATPESADGYMLLSRLCQELGNNAAGNSDGSFQDFSKIVQTFQMRIRYTEPGKQLILFIDALNQLSQADPASELTWLPKMLPKNVRLIISTKPGDTQEKLAARIPSGQWLEVNPLLKSDAADLLDNWLEKEANRQLTQKQYAEVIKNTNPLYLRLAYEEARLWHSYDDLPIGPERRSGLGFTSSQVMESFINRLSRDEYHGKTLVTKTLLYLAAARNGLNEDELIDLLSADLDVYINFIKTTFHFPEDLLKLTRDTLSADAKTAEKFLHDLKQKENELSSFINGLLENSIQLRLPVVIWSRLLNDLKPYLSETVDNGNLLIKFFHDELREVAQGLSRTSQERKAIHLNIAQYFSEQSRYANRRLEEQPWQLAEAESWHALAALLSNEPMFNLLWERKPYDVRKYWSQLEGIGQIRIEIVFNHLIERPKDFSSYTLLNFVRLMWELGHGQKILSLIEYLMIYFDEQNDLYHYQVIIGYWSSIQQMSGNLQNALKGYEVQESINRQTNNNEDLSAALGNQAVIYQKLSQYKRANALLEEQALLCRKTKNHQGLAIALGNLALNQRMQGNLSEALTLHQQEEKIFREIGESNGLSRSLLNQAGIYALGGETKKALSLLEQSEKLARQFGNLESLQAVLGNQGEIYLNLEELDNAMSFCKEQERICREIGNQEDLIASLGNQGAIYLKRREYDQALPLLKETEALARQTGNLRILSLTLSNLASILDEQKRYNEALALFQEMEKICVKIGQVDGLILCLTNQAVAIYHGKLASQEIIDQKLEKALKLAKNYGYTRFIDQIEDIIRWVRKN